MTVRSGHYFALSGRGKGDRLLALRAAELWAVMHVDPSTIGGVDGVTFWEGTNGVTGASACFRDPITGLRSIRELDPDTGEVFTSTTKAGESVPAFVANTPPGGSP